jgi:hypothetical protein
LLGVVKFQGKTPMELFGEEDQELLREREHGGVGMRIV